MQYCIYLRKSRTDTEAEERGEGETLARHEKILLELAKKLKINITKVYHEIVSGETISARPVMKSLLQEVEQNIWEGVFVMEVERLARGDTIDQGIVAQTFKYSNTKIITPIKIYDPNNEFDEEYFEFGLFMSRREYKTINRRLQRGRIASVQEGKYVGNKAPYGYERINIVGDKGFTLTPIKQEAEVVNLIYQWYTVGEKQLDSSYKRLGTSLIAHRLNSMKVPAKMGGNWVASTIRDILINPIYIGMVRWNWRQHSKKIIDGKVVITRPRCSSKNCILAKGLHPAIISTETFNLAQEFMSKNPPRPVGQYNTVKNPLAGIVVCGKCGHRMVRRPHTDHKQLDTLMCTTPTCNNVSSVLYLVEERILQSLDQWLGSYKLKWNIKPPTMPKVSQADIKQKALSNKKSELDMLYKQLSKTHDLLEQDVYDTETFLRRTRSVSQRINLVKTAIKALETDLEIEIVHEESVSSIIPKVEKLVEVYKELQTAKAKNDILKEVLEKIVYVKKNRTRWHGSPDNFEITIYPKIPSYIDNK